MSLFQAKHEMGTTLGKHPDLYPYVLNHISEHPVQEKLRHEIAKQQYSAMMGAPDEAQFLGWLIGLTGAKKVIEVGVFRGSTTLAMALQLPAGGKIVGLDVTDAYVQVGKQAWVEAGVYDRIDLRVGPAVDAMDRMIQTPGEKGTYDLVFIDADKPNYPLYYERALELLRPNGIIAIDNVLWGGCVNKPVRAGDRDTQAFVELNEKVRKDPRVHAVMLPIADGCYFVRKL
eukprot:GDKI01021768.1.p1 GENE.GDKI01021768.1~~GDKI01021768.1.p1  ORF type:complete len:230 (-),score=75.78 GDKI01021768.1:586-1275(-)